MDDSHTMISEPSWVILEGGIVKGEGELTEMASSNLRYRTARHEAGHAVMRWALDLPATPIRVGEGEGYCAGTKEIIPDEIFLLVALAGYASEEGYGLNVQHLKCNDFDKAKELLECKSWLRIRSDVESPCNDGPSWVTASVDEALQAFYDEACDMLNQSPFSDAINVLAGLLVDKSSLTKGQVAKVLRSFEE